MITPRRRPAGPDEVARHYDELDLFYRGLWGEHLHHGLFEHGREDPQVAAERLVDRVAELAALEPGMAVCDVGCGYGATARKLAFDRRVHVVGLTLSSAQLAFLRARHASPRSDESSGSTRFLQADWLDNPFAPDTFDVIVAIECLTHMPDQRAFFRVAERVLRPGGRLVVCAWLATEAVGPLRRRHLLEPICAEGELAGMATAAETEGFIGEADLELIEHRDLSHSVRRTWSIVTARVARALATDPEARRLLADRRVRSRHFARSILRIWAAYRTGAMQYGLFVIRKPPGAFECSPYGQ